MVQSVCSLELSKRSCQCKESHRHWGAASIHSNGIIWTLYGWSSGIGDFTDANVKSSRIFWETLLGNWRAFTSFFLGFRYFLSIMSGVCYCKRLTQGIVSKIPQTVRPRAALQVDLETAYLAGCQRVIHQLVKGWTFACPRGCVCIGLLAGILATLQLDQKTAYLAGCPRVVYQLVRG